MEKFHLYDSKRLSALEKKRETGPAVLQFTSFIPGVGEDNLRSISPASISLPDSIQFVRNIDHLIASTFLDIRNTNTMLICACL